MPASTSQVLWHPVAFHCLDVAAVVDRLFEVRPSMRAAASRLLMLEEPRARALVVGIVSLHDIGKFALPFQFKRPDLLRDPIRQLNPLKIPATQHTNDGLLLWDHALVDRLAARGWPSTGRIPRILMSAVFGHHGAPARASGEQLGAIFGKGSLKAAEECCEAMLGMLGDLPALPAALTEKDACTASWWLAGYCSLSDWIGSNQQWFEYTVPSLSLADYWGLARRRAKHAVAQAGLECPRSAGRKSFAELTRKPTPTPVQEWAESVELPTGRLLVIIEDVTGSGKTEAAQVLVHRLLAAGRADGVFWAMPTQATANAMYKRQGDAIGSLFAEAPAPSLVLAHGQARLHEKFRQSILPPGQVERATGDSPADLTATAACAAFLADDRRVSLLADVGAGTIDQAFLGVLPSRFNCIRLAGLSGKVLVLDEVHAYDPYMSVEAERLLTFQSALGGHSIILSATLRAEQRNSLVNAWLVGIEGRAGFSNGLFGGGPPTRVRSMEYPLGTIASETSVTEHPLSCPPFARREVAIQFEFTVEQAALRVAGIAEAGGAVAWIRNTVKDCLDAANTLRAMGCAPIVFHSRFAQGDRQRRELEVLDIFGPDAKGDGRRGKILVATQVIEQSLDLDFDFLVSDLAPMDLLIQRAGRLWRHRSRDSERPVGLTAMLVVLAPAGDVPLDHKWPGTAFKGTKAVYENVGVLWNTLTLLRNRGAIRSPDEVRHLVEAAYDHDSIPEELEAEADKALGKASADLAAGGYAVLDLHKGYDGSRDAWESDLAILTRLGDKQITMRLAKVGADRSLSPWVDVANEKHAWALSEVKYSAAKVPFSARPPAEYLSAVRALQATWGPFDADTPVLALRQGEDGKWSGALNTAKKHLRFHYSSDDGLDLMPGQEAD